MMDYKKAFNLRDPYTDKHKLMDQYTKEELYRWVHYYEVTIALYEPRALKWVFCELGADGIDVYRMTRKQLYKYLKKLKSLWWFSHCDPTSYIQRYGGDD